MINIEYDRDNLILKMKGHANAVTSGNDPICAAASMLMYTLAQNVLYLQDAGVAENAQIILEEGNALVSCRAKEDKETLLCVFDTVTTGFVLLAGNYRENVKFTERVREEKTENVELTEREKKEEEHV